MSDEFGDRMKRYESATAGARLTPLIPAMARIDGKNFSKWTRGLERPYDARLSSVMVGVTKKLIEETGALMGYTQSDEISLCWYSPVYDSKIYFDGRIQKMVGDLTAIASLEFNRLVAIELPDRADKLARFDARVWNVPTLEEAANTFLWREIDATKNSVSMAARSIYSHKQLHGKGRAAMMDMLMDKGVNWNDYPSFFKRGTWIRYSKISKVFNAEEIASLPPMHNARKNPHLEFERKILGEVDMPSFRSVTNRVGVIFNGETPLTLATL